MQRFVEKIVNLMKSESLFEPQGGPIIMSQVERVCFTRHLLSFYIRDLVVFRINI